MGWVGLILYVERQYAYTAKSLHAHGMMKVILWNLSIYEPFILVDGKHVLIDLNLYTEHTTVSYTSESCVVHAYISQERWAVELCYLSSKRETSLAREWVGLDKGLLEREGKYLVQTVIVCGLRGVYIVIISLQKIQSLELEVLPLLIYIHSHSIYQYIGGGNGTASTAIAVPKCS